jgi:hypothetical protein
VAAGAETDVEHPSRAGRSRGRPGSDRAAGTGRPFGLRGRWLDLAAVLALVVLALVAVLPQVVKQAPLSALDEPSHLDYAWNASHFEIPAAGDAIAPEVVAIWNCYGNELVDLPACGTTGPAEAYPALGLQYNFAHPPLYYLITGVAAGAIAAVSEWDFLTAARALGAVWLAAGMAVMHVALRRLGVGVAVAVSVAALSGMWWPTLSAATIVTNDAPFLLTTALGLLALGVPLRSPRRWLGPVLLVVLAALAAGMKVMNALPFLAIAGAFVVLALLPERFRPWAGRGGLAATAAGLVAAVGGVYVLWSRFQAGRGDPDWTNPVEGVNTMPFDGSPFGEWLPTTTRGLTFIGHSYVSSQAADQALISVTVSVASIVALAAIAIGMAVGRRGSPLLTVALTGLIGSAAWPLVVQVQAYLSSGGTHYFLQPSYRYGVTMGIVAFAALALVAERLRWQLVTIVGCVLVVATTLVAVFAVGRL